MSANELNEIHNHQQALNPQSVNPVRSLRELVERVSGKDVLKYDLQHDTGLAEPLSFPFLAIVGQYEMKLALVLTLINPNIGGVLLIGPRGTAKTTSIRGLVDILPEVENSLCQFGCLPEDIDNYGVEGVCVDCAKKYGENIPLSEISKVRIIELPLNTSLESVTGNITDKTTPTHPARLKRGILSLADKNILYIDEVNLLPNEIINAILDASAMGKFSVRKGASIVTFRSKFSLVGSMNPEEGNLRPQIMDRFGLRVVTKGLEDANSRLKAYERTALFAKNAFEFINLYAEENQIARKEIEAARKRVWNVSIEPDATKFGVSLVQKLNIQSLRAEITLFEAAKALAASDNRKQVSIQDVIAVAPMSLRMRRSAFITNFNESIETEDLEINDLISHYSSEDKL